MSESLSGTQHKTYCRHCQSICGMVATVEDNRVTKIRGDRDHPVSQGYSCMMGQHSLLLQDSPERLTTAQRRTADGAFSPMPVTDAVREVGEKLKDLLDRYGPRSIALYYGTGTAYSGLAYGIAKSWLRAIDSPEHYSSMTVDSSSMYVCMRRMGMFATGRPQHSDLDVVLLVGNNPAISHQGWSRSPLPSANPRKGIAEGQAQGMKLIVIDPRLTETARKADLFLQVKPGEDCTLLAAMLRVMLERGWTDPTFHDRFCTSIPALRAAVEPFNLAYAEHRTGLAPQARRMRPPAPGSVLGRIPTSANTCWKVSMLYAAVIAAPAMSSARPACSAMRTPWKRLLLPTVTG
jgi:anaerobic selenocysteine-containing dehydrogenase